MKRAGAATLLIVAVAGVPRVARADERLECAKAYEQTQRLRQKNDNLGALDDAQRCARATCPELLRHDCVQWATEIESKLARVTVRVRGADGCPRADPIVEVSGVHRPAPSGGVMFDAGVHELRVVDSVSGRVKTETIDFGPGERRDIDFDFAGPDVACGATSAPPPGKTRPIPKASIILGGIGGGLLLTGITLGIVGAAKRGGLDDCKPACSQDRIDGVRGLFVAGDVIGALGLLAVGAGLATYLLTGRSTQDVGSAF